MMKKSDILKKISEQVARGILNPDAGEPVGLKITKQALGKSKKENDEYYKSLDKKFTDYLKMGGKDEPSPKVNMTDEERKMYYGTGMEGLKYDDEGTPKYEKFVKRNEELNKPSKDYYLDKDGVDDSYDRIMKDGKAYKKHKYEKPDEYQKTPKVRVTKESVNKKTMKQLNFKKPFLTQERVMKLIPESFKVNGNKFKMSDGVETYTIKWEGNTKTGTPTPLQYKNGTLIKEDVSKMKHLYDYNSQDTLMKTNDALTENQIFSELLGKSRLLKEQGTTVTPTTPAGTTPTQTTTKPAATAVPVGQIKKEVPQTLTFGGKVGDENKDVSFTITYVRNNGKFDVTNTQLLIDGKRFDNPTKTTVDEFANSAEIYPSDKSVTKYESVYTIVKRASEDKRVVTFNDSKKLLANAKTASMSLPHQYREYYTVKPIPYEDVNIQFYPYKMFNQTNTQKTACVRPPYFSVISKDGKVKSPKIRLGDQGISDDQFDDEFNNSLKDTNFVSKLKQNSTAVYQGLLKLGSQICKA